MRKIAISMMMLWGVLSAAALEQNAMKVKSVRVTEHIVIDGKLTEDAWKSAPLVDTFIQYQPVNGIPAEFRTEVHVAYDDAALYVGAHMVDPAPDSLTALLCRRDADVSTDLFAVLLDTYHDMRTGFYFGLSPSGTMFDGTIVNDGNTNGSWDGVWEGKAARVEDGWCAEFRIPFSQLRFQSAEELVWGINFIRDVARRNDRSQIIRQPKNESGFVSRFAQLVGIKGITPPARVEVLPYVTGRAELTHPDAGDPFHSRNAYTPGAGADVKFGIGSNLTLDATINPDFGQVEVDPAVVNLSDVETFYDEKRPFFMEGANIFSFGTGGSNSNWNFNWPSVQFFYSRRIGRAPQGSLPDYDYADIPNGTKILGAAKLSGKIGDNWSLGTIHAVTRSERARTTYNGVRSEFQIEPAAYYGLARVQKEFSGGEQALGFYGSLVQRSLEERRLRNDVNDRALVAGVDGYTFMGDSRDWVLAGWFGGSRVEGTPERILALQENSRHYFQRPEDFRIDSSAAALNGFGAKLRLNKEKGNLLWNSSVGMLSPGFELSDLGFVSRVGLVNWHTGTGYRVVEPGSWYQSLFFLFAIYGNYDYDGTHTAQGYFHLGEIQLKNFWWINYRAGYNPETINTRMTRGGPAALNPSGLESGLSISTNSSLPLYFSIGYNGYHSSAETFLDIAPEIRYQPLPNLSVSVSPEYMIDDADAQWVDRVDDAQNSGLNGHHYLFGRMQQTQISASIRLNWTFTPELSLQLYVQPLISQGKFDRFKELAAPGTFTFNEVPSAWDTLRGGTHSLYLDGTASGRVISFSNPDFNTKSLRGNMILRWEYRPGSVFYLVWTQNRFDGETGDGKLLLSDAFNKLWRMQVDNIFMLKFTYYFAS